MSISSVTFNPVSANSVSLSAQPSASEPTPLTAPTAQSGDRRLMELYVSGLRQSTASPAIALNIEGIPADSYFGEWWNHLYDTTHSQAFLAWAKKEGIDTTHPISIDHANDTLSVVIKGERRELHRTDLSQDGRNATEPVMIAAKAVSPTPLEAPSSPDSAPLHAVAHFHGEVLLPHMKDRMLSRATQLEQNHGFYTLNADETYVNLDAQRPARLMEQKAELGNSENKLTLLQKLTQQHSTLTNTSIPVEHWLANTTMPIHPSSGIAQDTQQNEASLEDVLNDAGWQIPTNAEELGNLIDALTAPSLPVLADGNFGGARTWPEPLSKEDQSELFRIIADNDPPLTGLDDNASLGTTDVLGALMKNVPRSILNQNDPIAVVQWILGSDEGRQLGQELKQRMGEVAQNSTPREILLTALGVTLDFKSLTDPKSGQVAGFDLASPEHYGQPLSVVKQRLIEHLVRTHQTTVQAAPVAALLLLSSAAPELLIKDIPADTTYGSFAWLTLKTAAARIDVTSPGASTRMTAKEVIDFSAIEPATDHEQEVQAAAELPALIEWGKANGTLPLQETYTAEQLKNTRDEIDQQLQATLKATEALATPIPTQRSMALAELKARFGEDFPVEEKSIRTRHTTTDSHRLTPSITTEHVGYYSLLDLYLAKKAGLDVGWHSPNPRISASVIRQVQTLPDPIEKHSAAFDEYAANLSAAWSTVTKNLIADLPIEDRKNIEWGQLTVYQAGSLSRQDTNTPNGHITGDERFSGAEGDRSLIIKTERNGLTAYYQIDPQRGVLKKRDDLEKDGLQEGRLGPWVQTQDVITTTYTAPAIERISPSEDDVAKEQAGAESLEAPKSLSSTRSDYVGKLLSDHIVAQHNMADLKQSTSEATTFDQETESKEFWRTLILGFIPGASAVRNVINGHYIEAAGDVIFDVVAAVTFKGLGKGLKPGRGMRTVRKLSKNFSPLSRSTKRLDGFIGQVTKRGRNRVSSSGESLRKLASSPDNVNLHALSQQRDIAAGTYKTSSSAQPLNTVAKYDDVTQKWSRYDVSQNKTYGNPLENFTPENARYFDNTLGAADDVTDAVVRRKRPNHLERGLHQDKAIDIGADVKDFKSLGDGIFTYVDNYKGVERLNVVAHGVNPNFKQLLADEPMNMFYNGKQHTATELLDTLKASGIDPTRYNNTRLIMCHSANGSANSFGRQFSTLIKRDVKAFQGPVRAYVTPEDVAGKKMGIRVDNPEASGADINQKIMNQFRTYLSFGTNKGGALKPGEIPFFYRPVKFKAP